MKKKIMLFMIPFITLVTIFIYHFLFHDGIDIKVQNQTDKEISGLYITYDEIKSDVKIPSLKPNEKYKLNVSHSKNSNEEFDEGAMVLKYMDKEGKIHTEYISGYIERGYSGFANIKITDVEENGKLKMKITDFTY